jgi:hypothetical protein
LLFFSVGAFFSRRKIKEMMMIVANLIMGVFIFFLFGLFLFVVLGAAVSYFANKKDAPAKPAPVAELVKSVAEPAQADEPKPQSPSWWRAPEWIRALFSGWGRTVIFGVAGVALYLPYVTSSEPTASLRALGSVGLLVLGFMLIDRVRRVLRPYVDLRECVDHSKAGNIAMAIVALGAILGDVIALYAFVNVMMFR